MPSRSSLRTLVPAAFVAAVGLGVSSAAAQEASDNCVDAPLITPGTYSGATVGATRDGISSCAPSAAAPDVWYRITPAENAMLLLDLCASGFDTVVSLHTGCPGSAANQVACNDQSCGDQSRLSAFVTAGQTYYIRISGWASLSGAWSMTVDLVDPPPFTEGPDVVYHDVSGTFRAGPVGGVHAYAYGTVTCNYGSENLLWTSGATPGVVFNLYRLHDGRLMQIGQSWAKIACCAAAGPGCGLYTCNGVGGSRLGAGCRDVYGAGYNAAQTRLRPRSMINPWTGEFSGQLGSVTNAVDRLCQVPASQMQLANYPGSQFFAEGVYVATDEASFESKANNASYRPVAVNQSTFDLTFPANAPTNIAIPAILAWRDHGNGLNTPDENVHVQTADVPGEGRFYVAHTVRDNGDGTWRYDYAVFNLNSHRSGGSFAVPVGAGTNVTGVGFHSVPYHSGEPYDNSPWTALATGGTVTWSSPQTFAQNANTNALRWGTMYNFWFTADRPPADAQATLGLFRPGIPGSIAATVSAPTGGPGQCRTDFNGDGVVNSSDISAFLTQWLIEVTGWSLMADFNNDGVVNSSDISAFISAWLEDVTDGC